MKSSLSYWTTIVTYFRIKKLSLYKIGGPKGRLRTLQQLVTFSILWTTVNNDLTCLYFIVKDNMTNRGEGVWHVLLHLCFHFRQLLNVNKPFFYIISPLMSLTVIVEK